MLNKAAPHACTSRKIMKAVQFEEVKKDYKIRNPGTILAGRQLSMSCNPNAVK